MSATNRSSSCHSTSITRYCGYVGSNGYRKGRYARISAFVPEYKDKQIWFSGCRCGGERTIFSGLAGLFLICAGLTVAAAQKTEPAPIAAESFTKDWEFFELDVADGKSTIRTRGFVDVVNRFGGNCFACHIKARPEFDLICETGHGCDPIPLAPVMIKAIQKTDPRCGAPEPLTDEEAAMLKALQAAMAPKPAAS